MSTEPSARVDPRAIEALPDEIRAPIRQLVERGEWSGRIAADALPDSGDGTLLALVALAQSFARAPISGFRVGAVARSPSGDLYVGANLEFAGCSLAATVHAEQTATVSAWVHGEVGVERLAVSAAPCGRCRQFLFELSGAERIQIVLPPAAGRGAHRVIPVGDLLPDAFGPGDLGMRGGWMDRAQHGHGLVLADPSPAARSDPLVLAALEQANRSYAVYTRAWAGAAVRTRDGAVCAAPSVENAAFNPSLTALQGALACLTVGGRGWEEITAAALVEAENPTCSQRAASEELLGAVADASLVYALARAGAAR